MPVNVVQKEMKKQGLSLINPRSFIDVHNKECLVVVFKRIEYPEFPDPDPEYPFIANNFFRAAWVGLTGKFPDLPD
jgi:hypothetical protein